MAARRLAHWRDTYVGPQAPVFATATGTELDPNNLRRKVLRPVALGLGYYELVEGKDGKPREWTKSKGCGFESHPRS
jgi:hypothetical protein